MYTSAVSWVAVNNVAAAAAAAAAVVRSLHVTWNPPPAYQTVSTGSVLNRRSHSAEKYWIGPIQFWLDRAFSRSTACLCDHHLLAAYIDDVTLDLHWDWFEMTLSHYVTLITKLTIQRYTVQSRNNTLWSHLSFWFLWNGSPGIPPIFTDANCIALSTLSPEHYTHHTTILSLVLLAFYWNQNKYSKCS